MVRTQLQNLTSKKLKLYIIKTIFEQNKLPKEVPKNKVHYHLKPFLKNKIVEKKGYGTWQLTKLGRYLWESKQLQILKRDNSFQARKNSKQKTKIRGHGFMWTLQIPHRCQLNSEKRRKLAQSQGFQPIELDKGKQKIFIRGHNIHLNQRSITVYFDKTLNFMGKSANESYKAALFEFEQVIRKAEKIYNSSLRIKGFYKFKVSRQHYGHLDNEMAIHYKNNNRFVRVFDRGKEWLVMDFSDKQYIEAETVDTERAKYDQDSVIQPFMNTIRNDPQIMDKLKKENEELKKIMSDTQEMVKTLMQERNKSINIDRFIY